MLIVYSIEIRRADFSSKGYWKVSDHNILEARTSRERGHGSHLLIKINEVQKGDGVRIVIPELGLNVPFWAVVSEVR